MQTMKTGRSVLNPFASVTPEVAVASAAPESTKEIATASALSNSNPSQCPKCGAGMTDALLANSEVVYYCQPCRVTNPIPA